MKILKQHSFWIGFYVATVISSLGFGYLLTEKFVSKHILKSPFILIDGKIYDIKERK